MERYSCIILSNFECIHDLAHTYYLVVYTLVPTVPYRKRLYLNRVYRYHTVRRRLARRSSPTLDAVVQVVRRTVKGGG